MEFPGVQGFSARNLWLMRRFYIEYSKKDFMQPLEAKNSSQISSEEGRIAKVHPLGAERGKELQTVNEDSEKTKVHPLGMLGKCSFT